MGHYGVGRDRRCPLAFLAAARIVLVTAITLTAKMWSYVLGLAISSLFLPAPCHLALHRIFTL